MEGTWGRRIFGTVHKGASTTRFHLVMETREKEIITQINYASNDDLEQFPELYGLTLDLMVQAIDNARGSKYIP